MGIMKKNRKKRLKLMHFLFTHAILKILRKFRKILCGCTTVRMWHLETLTDALLKKQTLFKLMLCQNSRHYLNWMSVENFRDHKLNGWRGGLNTHAKNSLFWANSVKVLKSKKKIYNKDRKITVIYFNTN